MQRLFIASYFCLWSFVQIAQAGPLDEMKAKAHLQAAADGNLDALMRDYAEDAYMDWIGGPLDGRYRGKAAISEVWKKFIANNNGKSRSLKFSNPEAYSNANGTSVEVKAEYGGERPVKVWQVMTYRDGNLVTEIWHVAPAIKISP